MAAEQLQCSVVEFERLFKRKKLSMNVEEKSNDDGKERALSQV